MRQYDERRVEPESVEIRLIHPIRRPQDFFREMPRPIRKPRLALATRSFRLSALSSGVAAGSVAMPGNCRAIAQSRSLKNVASAAVR